VVPLTGRRLLAAAVAAVLVAGCTLDAKPKAAPTPTATATSRAPGGIPVFVVPGYGGDASSVEHLVTLLDEFGLDVRVVVAPDGGRAPIADGAAALDRAVRASGAAQVALIGYSMGGLVVRDWVAERGGATLAHTVLTVGAPHHGSTALASLPAADCTGACADMKPGSALLKRLNAGDETTDGPSWVSVWSGTDTNVTPLDTARLAGATNVRIQDHCQGVAVSHAELASNDALIPYYWQVLTAGPEAAHIGCGSLRSSLVS
jgi:triacylglycerol esterase/lipase EstA (alpha/beta hydrolase family)